MQALPDWARETLIEHETDPRSRSLDWEVLCRAQKLMIDLGRYAQIVSKPASGRRLRVIVVGAGMAGLSAARTLVDQGHEVVVLKKSRGPGGRMSTRRKGELRFDHGAQYFTASDPRFQRHVVAWQERGLVERWEARIGAATKDDIKMLNSATERFIPGPSMNQICQDMMRNLEDVRFDWQANSFEYEDEKWTVQSNKGQSNTGDSVQGDILILTAPPGQVRSLLVDDEVDAARHLCYRYHQRLKCSNWPCLSMGKTRSFCWALEKTG